MSKDHIERSQFYADTFCGVSWRYGMISHLVLRRRIARKDLSNICGNCLRAYRAWDEGRIPDNVEIVYRTRYDCQPARLAAA